MMIADNFKAIAILPVKRFAIAKQRLSDETDRAFASAVMTAMFDDFCDVLAACERVDDVIVASSEPLAAARARSLGWQVAGEPEIAGHSEAAALAIESVVQKPGVIALMLAADCPLADADEIDSLIGRVADERIAVGVVPDRHSTGTNALALTPADAIMPSFGPDSHRRHLDLAATAGATAATIDLPSLATDVDTLDDLIEVATLIGDGVAVNLQHALLTPAFNRFNLPGGIAR